MGLKLIARSPKGAQAAVDANVLDCVAELLSSPFTWVHEPASALISEIAGRESISFPGFGGGFPCVRLVFLLR
jgi:hypothetical protein